jgi:hypothetical protein
VPPGRRTDDAGDQAGLVQSARPLSGHSAELGAALALAFVMVWRGAVDKLGFLFEESGE